MVTDWNFLFKLGERFHNHHQVVIIPSSQAITKQVGHLTPYIFL